MIRSEGQLAALEETPFELEDVLQRLLTEHPDLLAGDQMNVAAPRRWLLVTREAGVPDQTAVSDRWSVDHLFLDQDGIPTLVEVKRSSDTRLRREVIGQMLDYAANAVVYWPPERIRERFEASCETQGGDPVELLDAFLGGDEEVEGFWERVRTNLQAERIRLILVTDELPRETRRLIEFLNGQIDPAEVLAVQIRQYAGDGLKTLVPQVVGTTAEADRKKTAARQARQWDPESFDEELTRRHDADQAQVAQQIRRWAEERGLRIDWGRGATYGAFLPRLQHAGAQHPTFSISTGGYVQIHFGVMHHPPFDSLERRRELYDRLSAIPDVELRAQDLTKEWPTIPLAVLTEGSRLEAFLNVWDWFVDQVREAAATDSG